MFLVDTNVISEARKGRRADTGVIDFIQQPENEIFLPVQVIGELRRGVDNLRRKGDVVQAKMLENWFHSMLEEFSKRILVFDSDCAQVWGALIGVNPQNLIDRQIAAIALVYNLTVVTRDLNDFSGTGVRLLNPFVGDGKSASANPKAQ